MRGTAQRSACPSVTTQPSFAKFQWNELDHLRTFSAVARYLWRGLDRIDQHVFAGVWVAAGILAQIATMERCGSAWPAGRDRLFGRGDGSFGFGRWLLAAQPPQAEHDFGGSLCEELDSRCPRPGFAVSDGESLYPVDGAVGWTARGYRRGDGKGRHSTVTGFGTDSPDPSSGR